MKNVDFGYLVLSGLVAAGILGLSIRAFFQWRGLLQMLGETALFGGLICALFIMDIAATEATRPYFHAQADFL